MKRSIQFSFLMTLVLILVACGGDGSPSGPDNPDDPDGSEEQIEATTGTLEVVASTSGNDQDADGYTVFVDGDSVTIVDPSGTITVEDLEEGSYDVELGDLQANCAIDGDNPQTADIVAEEMLSLNFDIGCEAAITNQIVYTSDAGEGTELYVMEVDGSNPTQLTDNSVSEYFPQISPDGTKILFAKKTGGNTSNWQYFVIDAEGNNEQELTAPSEGASIFVNPYATWSPDGSKILFVTDRDGNAEIYQMDADGSNQTQITDDPAKDEIYKGAYSADGSQFLFASDRGSESDMEIYVADADGSNIEQLTDNSAEDFAAAWSPVEEKMAFVSDRDSNKEIYTMDSDLNVQRITDESNQDSSPYWSTDGSEIIFESNRNGDFEIYSIPSDGSGQPTNLTNDNTSNERSPSQSLLE